MRQIKNTDEIIDSRDIMKRIDELEEEDRGQEEQDELDTLISLRDQAQGYGDWYYGETLIHDDYFVEYTKELIKDCWELPKEFESGKWPWRHMQMNYEDAAEEAKIDYMELDFDGATYWMRA